MLRNEKVRSRRFTCLALLFATIPAGVLWRMAPLHLPPFAFKYGGSALWAAAVYWTVGAVFARWQPGRVAGIAAGIALGVELFKLVFWPPLDHFRQTLAGTLLLGRYFTWGAVLAYWIAITMVALLDRRVRFGPGPHATRSPGPSACPD